MGVTAVDIGCTVTWNEHGRPRTGHLHAVPEPGSPRWWATTGKADVFTEQGWCRIRPAELEVVQEVLVDG